MLRLDRLLPGIVLAAVVLGAAGCNRLTFVKPNLKKVKIEQVRRPVVAHDSSEVKARQSAQGLTTQASGLLQAGDVDGAEAKANEALKLDAASVDAHTLLAAVAERRGQAQAAGGWFKKAAELSGGRAAEVGNYGAWLCANGRAAESLQYLDYAAQAQYGTARADMLANLGACATNAGMDPQAEQALRDSIGLDPENTLALEMLARLSMRRGQWMEARAFIERRLALQPVDATVLGLAEQIETRLGDARAAAGYRARIQREFPQTVPRTTGR